MPAAKEIDQFQAVAPASRAEHVRYAIRDIAVLGDKLAREGRSIIPLHIGDPAAFDFATPPHLVDAVVKAMRDGKNGYTPPPGIPEAIEAIRASAARDGIRNVQTVFVTYGVSEAADICLTGLVNPGESVLTPCPNYPLYSAILAKLDARDAPYRLDESRGWEPDLDDLAAKVTPKTRALVVINPNNPTGGVYSRQTLERIADLARRKNLVVFSDEIYDKLILDDARPHVTFAALAPDIPVVTFRGLSKGYVAPGWRVGWVILSGPENALKDYAEALHRLARAKLSGSHPIQHAIRPALEGPQDHLVEVLRKLRARRDLTMEWCRETPRVSLVPPLAAFYAFPKLDLPGSDEDFVRELLLEKSVLAVHGSGFGPLGAAGHIRVVYLPDEETLRRAYRAIAEFMRERYP